MGKARGVGPTMERPHLWQGGRLAGAVFAVVLGPLSACEVQRVVAKLTSTGNDQKKIYGKLDDKVYNINVYEEVQSWIMDPNRCNTDWDVIHKIRNDHKGYIPGLALDSMCMNE